ncbi:MAG: sigma-70 family RNA polymerase sigma factor [Chloroflexota bacterium]
MSPPVPPDWDAVFAYQLPRVYNYVLYRVNNQQLAEDLTSTAFHRAWKSRANYRPEIAAVSTWLFTIARRVLVDYYRKNEVKIVPLDTVYDVASDESPEMRVQTYFEKQYLADAIAALPAREQEIVALKYGAELSHSEIAELLNISVSNVGTIANRTVNRLRGLLTQKEVKKHG